jgi:hypothetical protein
MKKWLASEPTLSEIDLRSYFYIAHDALGSLGTTQLRLTPLAKRFWINYSLQGQQVRRLDFR